jgi:hypothetical protein
MAAGDSLTPTPRRSDEGPLGRRGLLGFLLDARARGAALSREEGEGEEKVRSGSGQCVCWFCMDGLGLIVHWKLAGSFSWAVNCDSWAVANFLYIKTGRKTAQSLSPRRLKNWDLMIGFWMAWMCCNVIKNSSNRPINF